MTCHTTYRLNEYLAEYEAGIEYDEALQAMFEEVEADLEKNRRYQYDGRIWTIDDVDDPDSLVNRIADTDAYAFIERCRQEPSYTRSNEQLAQLHEDLRLRELEKMATEIAELILRGGR